MNHNVLHLICDSMTALYKAETQEGFSKKPHAISSTNNCLSGWFEVFETWSLSQQSNTSQTLIGWLFPERCFNF